MTFCAVGNYEYLVLDRNRAPAAAADIGVNEDEEADKQEVAGETADGGKAPYSRRAEGMRTP
jgi:hypothetical protein